MGVVILTNLNGTPVTDIIERNVYDRLLRLEPINWNDRYAKEAARAAEQLRKTLAVKDPGYLPETSPSHPLDTYTGTYESKGYGAISIILEGDSLSTTLLKIKCPLRHYNYDVFDLYHPVEHQSWKISFESDLAGSINSFKLNPGPGMKEVLFTKKD